MPSQFSIEHQLIEMLFLLLLLLCLLLLLLLWQKRQLILLGWSLAGPWALPGLGNAQMIGKLKPEFIFLVFTEMRERYGATYRLWLGPQLWVFLHSAQETRDALHTSTLRKAVTFQQLSPLIGNGLLISHGREWAAQRRLLTPCFQAQLLRSFAPAALKHANRLIDKLQRTKASEMGIEVTDYLFACLLDAIVDTSMGYQLDTQLQNEESRLVHAFHRSGKLLFKRMINPLLTFDFVFKRTRLWRELSVELRIIHEKMEQIIEQRHLQLQMQQEREQAEGKPRILLDAMLLAGLDRQQIRDQVNTFVFAGVDTTTAAMSFVLYALAKHPETQQKLHEELKDFTADEATCDDLLYLDAVLKEVLRLYTIVPTTGRQTTKDTTIGGRKYCAGVTIWINMYGLAHDERYFPEPYKFQPERWLHNDSKNTPYSYIPYSGGPHVCIGRKYSLLLMKLLTVRIVQHFQLELKDPQAELVLQAQMVLRSRDGINIKFTPR